MGDFLEFLKTNHDALSIFVSTVSAGCFIISVLTAFASLARARQLQKENTARNIFNDYLKTAMINPVFAYPTGFRDEYDLENRTVGKGENARKHFEEYEWFVSVLVFSMKEILDIFYHDKYWRETAKRQLGYQIDYLIWRRSLGGPNFIALAGYRVNKMIDEIHNELNCQNEPNGIGIRWFKGSIKKKNDVI